MYDKYPGTILNYLEANFPFIDKFPLLPHLSHNDGKKLDVSFHYVNAKTGEHTNVVPSWLGYGFAKNHGWVNLIGHRTAHGKDTGNTALYHRAFPKRKKTNTRLTPNGQRILLIFM